ncbi:hypothetical protein SAMN05444413_12225 [Roseivivax marinus]|uniref:DUF6212 domain-containing protein n=1 Tax=Roseivivax marinus TaxID=1379903 RepID=UPI0008BD15A7|nr:DUF6212 domain-containing protein [Roseivivax marinus]SEL92100.1 hypothetical protein SAMN05444413_12225 [Roseivivax marinus]
MRHKMLLAAADFAEMNDLNLPVELVVVRLSERGDICLDNGQPFLPETMTGEVAGLIVGSPESRALLDEVATCWAARCGIASPPLIDLSDAQDPDREARRTHALGALASIYRMQAEAVVQHNAELLEMLSQLRIEHEAASRTVHALRTFIAGSLGTKRWLAQANGPLPGHQAPALEMPPHSSLSQRLAANSIGLSDIAIFLPEQQLPETGQLKATLSLIESGTEAATWSLEAPGLSPGWLRLSLPDALDDDEQTPSLHLAWHSDHSLRIGGGVFHPDPDYCAIIGEVRADRILAHRIWKHSPGSHPPMPEDGHWPEGPVPPQMYVDPLRLAALAASAGEDLKYFSDLEALQVHPRPEKISSARLSGAVYPGIRMVTATIGGRHPQGPNVEYALAVAPSRPVRELFDLVHHCQQTRCISDWVGLSGDREDELELILPEPADQGLDLYLLTRLGPGAAPAYGWATFRDIWLRI